ncbi:TetR/AcrR family transcriptional regulator [Rhodococcus sp. 1.20]
MAVTGRDAILSSAMSLFTERGYFGTTMRDIAKGADMTVASIYHHFASKQIILQEMMVSILKETISLTRDAVLQADTDSIDRLRALVTAWVVFHATRRPEGIIGASELRSLDREGHRLVVTLRDEQEMLFRDIISRGVSSGEFGTPHPQDAARALITMGFTISMWYKDSGPVSPHDMAERYCDLALDMVRAKR